MKTANAIHQEMVARGFVRDRRELRWQKFSGRLQLNGKNISMDVLFEHGDLIRPPKVVLTNLENELPLAVAHIQSDVFCYVREEEIVFDPLSPRTTTAICIQKAEVALDRLLRSDLSDEIAAELPQHWLGENVMVDLPNEFSGTAYIFTFQDTSGASRNLIGVEAKSLSRFGATKHRQSAADGAKIPIVVVNVPTKLTFKDGHKPPKNLKQLLAWLKSFDTQATTRLIQGVAALWPGKMNFAITSPGGIVGGLLVLRAFEQKSVTRPQFLKRVLHDMPDQVRVERFHGSQVDAQFILRRNMADQADLSGKNIAVVGVGTIGGFLSKFLAQSGAGMNGGSLSLYDKEELSAGNIGRHFLGVADIGKNKAVATRDEIERLCPDSDVRGIGQDVRHFQDDLKHLDLVVDATGERALSDVLNMQTIQDRAAGSKVAYLSVWIAGGGVAVQSVLVDGPEHACFRCLRLDDPALERFEILKRDHPSTLIPANCGEGSYFAYGVGAPAIAAGLATQISFDWVRQKPSPRFRTVRLVQDATMEVKNRDIAKRATCPACSGSLKDA